MSTEPAIPPIRFRITVPWAGERFRAGDLDCELVGWPEGFSTACKLAVVAVRSQGSIVAYVEDPAIGIAVSVHGPGSVDALEVELHRVAWRWVLADIEARRLAEARARLYAREVEEPLLRQLARVVVRWAWGGS